MKIEFLLADGPLPAVVDVVPRQGEEVWLPKTPGADADPWIVKWVRHDFYLRESRRDGQPDLGSHRITVRLIDPLTYRRLAAQY